MADARLEWLTERLLTAWSDGTAVSPAMLTFMLRRYIASGRPDLRGPLERGLAQAIERVGVERDLFARTEWLSTLSESALVVDDQQLLDAVGASLPSVVDDLERRVQTAYEPGEGLCDATIGEHFKLATSLLTVFELTSRTQYAMLAEELLQIARRRWWNESLGTFNAEFEANCRAVRVLCGLAALHADRTYLASAVIHRNACYATDARLTLAWLSAEYQDHPDAASLYGIALLDCLALSSDLH